MSTIHGTGGSINVPDTIDALDIPAVNAALQPAARESSMDQAFAIVEAKYNHYLNVTPEDDAERYAIEWIRVVLVSLLSDLYKAKQHTIMNGRVS